MLMKLTVLTETEGPVATWTQPGRIVTIQERKQGTVVTIYAHDPVDAVLPGPDFRPTVVNGLMDLVVLETGEQIVEQIKALVDAQWKDEDD